MVDMYYGDLGSVNVQPNVDVLMIRSHELINKKIEYMSIQGFQVE